MYTYICLYIYIERERERPLRSSGPQTSSARRRAGDKVGFGGVARSVGSTLGILDIVRFVAWSVRSSARHSSGIGRFGVANDAFGLQSNRGLKPGLLIYSSEGGMIRLETLIELRFLNSSFV